MGRAGNQKIKLPPGWVEHGGSGDQAEYRPRADGTTGVLQVSKFDHENTQFISGLDDLGAFAAELGNRLESKGQRWGRPRAPKQASCGSGRFGFATFEGGQFPAMIIWVTVANDVALMWTWLGPDLAADEIRQALQIVTDACRSGAEPAARA